MRFVSKKDNGFALIGIIAVIVIILGVGGAVYYVTTKNKDSTTNNSVSKEEAKAVEAECKKEIDDKDFCKFASTWSSDSEYKIVMKTTGGESSGMITSESDGQGNTSTVMVGDNGEEMKYISLNNDTYMYDSMSAVWIKYPGSEDDVSEEIDSDLDFDDSDLPESEQSTYVFIGKEDCGNKTCFKYQIKDPASPNMEQYVWFDDDEYKLYKYTSTEDGETIEMTIEYVNVEIKQPSPVQE